MTTPRHTRRALHDGIVVELWEDPEAPFACDERALAAYASAGSWEHLFNAVMLASDHRPDPTRGVFKAPLAGAPVAGA